jgi:hypothetical protein
MGISIVEPSSAGPLAPGDETPLGITSKRVKRRLQVGEEAGVEDSGDEEKDDPLPGPHPRGREK